MGVDALGRVLESLCRAEEGDDEGGTLLRLTGYRLSKRLGAGGGGAVYLGHREGSDRPVAIKILNTRGVRGGAREGRRAWRELDLLSQLRLPAVPRVIDYGLHEGRLFIATEFIDGCPLDRYCAGELGAESGTSSAAGADTRALAAAIDPGAAGAASGGGGAARAGLTSRPLDRRERVALLAKVADAVQSLHEHGVIHRDIKPSNILVDGSGLPVIIDMGIATLLAADVRETLTAEGSPLGSPAFMAPEQARGEREKVSTRSDVYGLGATGYVVLTGHTPHDMETTIHEAVRRVGQEPARRVRELDPSVPRALAAVLERAVAGRGEERYGSAGEFAADLRRWLRGEPVLAARTRWWRCGLQWMGRHPLACTALASCLLVVSILGTSLALAWWAGLRPSTIRTGLGADGEQWAEIRSLAGMKLRRWEGPEGTIPVALRLERDKAMGGGALFLVAPGVGSGDPWAEQLCAYTDRDVEHPEWTSGGGPPEIEMPPCDWFHAPQRFRCVSAAIEDIFVESPGVEIVAVFQQNRWAPSAVRVYDARGRVLYEAWHNGWITGVAWLSEPRLLVLAGFNSEVSWLGRGTVARVHTYPSVVMAIRPQFGARAGWIATPSAAGDLQAAWYRCLVPPEAVDLIVPDRRGSIGVTAISPSEFVLVATFVTLTLDERCVETRARQIDMKYYRSGDMPDPHSAFFLGDLPPLDPDRAPGARPANN